MENAGKELSSGPRVILEDLARRVPQYLEDVDQSKLVYPACRRTLSDVDGNVRSVWDHTRLEAMRYVMMVPGSQFELLSGPARQLEMMDAYLLQRPHAETVIDFTGTTTADFAIAIVAGLNWLTHCAQVAGVDPVKQSGTLRNFRKIVALAQRWWLTEGAIERCDQLLASGGQPPPFLDRRSTVRRNWPRCPLTSSLALRPLKIQTIYWVFDRGVDGNMKTMRRRPATGSLTSKDQQKRRSDYRALHGQLAWNDPQPDSVWDRRTCLFCN